MFFLNFIDCFKLIIIFFVYLKFIAEEALIKGDFEWINDYGISEIVTAEVNVKTLKGNHKSFLTNNVKSLAEMINKKL